MKHGSRKKNYLYFVFLSNCFIAMKKQSWTVNNSRDWLNGSNLNGPKKRQQKYSDRAHWVQCPTAPLSTSNIIILTFDHVPPWRCAFLLIQFLHAHTPEYEIGRWTVHWWNCHKFSNYISYNLIANLINTLQDRHHFLLFKYFSQIKYLFKCIKIFHLVTLEFYGQ